MLLQELFKSKVDYEVESNNDESFVTTAVINGRKITFYAESMGEGSWHVGFSEELPKEKQNGWKQHTSKLTGSGAAPQVLSMVADSMREFIEAQAPQHIEFTAAKEDRSRASVYERMLKRLLPSDWTVDLGDAGDDMVFDLMKKQ